jgi:hypothetical protein
MFLSNRLGLVRVNVFKGAEFIGLNVVEVVSINPVGPDINGALSENVIMLAVFM